MNIFAEVIILLVMIPSFKSITAQLTAEGVAAELNAELQLEVNVLLNCHGQSASESYRSILSSSSIPLIIYSKADVSVKPIYQQHTKNLLAIVWLNETASITKYIHLLDRLLWKLHWIEIFFITEGEAAFNYLQLFEQCWGKGFTNVLLWHRGLLFSYHPYPEIQVVQVLNVKVHLNKNHLSNFLGRKINVPFRQSVPHCFAYRNLKGELKLAGYWYQLVDLFIKHYNGRTNIYFVSVEQTKNRQDVLNMIISRPFDFIPASLYSHDYFANSNVFDLARVVIICSMPAEVAKSLYLISAFDVDIWLLCLLVFIVFWLLITFKYRLVNKKWLVAVAYLDALTIFLYQMSRYAKERGILIFMLQLMPLLTGFLLSNFYNCNLSSMLTAKIYETPLTSLEDLVETNKNILVSTYNIEYELSLDSVPDYIKKRLISVNSKYEFYLLRRNLTVEKYFYIEADDLAQFVLFQQKNLGRPFAKALEQALYIRPYFFAMPHRSPYLQLFNRYLLYVHENGLYQKLKNDVKWEGIIAREIEFFVHRHGEQALDLTYFYSAIALLSIGLTCSLIVFLFEINFLKILCKIKIIIKYKK